MVNKNKSLVEIVKDSIGIGVIFHFLYSGVTAITNSQPFLDKITDRNTLYYSLGVAAGMGLYKIFKKLTDN